MFLSLFFFFKVRSFYPDLFIVSPEFITSDASFELYALGVVCVGCNTIHRSFPENVSIKQNTTLSMSKLFLQEITFLDGFFSHAENSGCDYEDSQLDCNFKQRHNCFKTEA